MGSFSNYGGIIAFLAVNMYQLFNIMYSEFGVGPLLYLCCSSHVQLAPPVIPLMKLYLNYQMRRSSVILVCLHCRLCVCVLVSNWLVQYVDLKAVMYELKL